MEAEPLELTVTCPEGSGAGDLILVEAANGGELEVVVPVRPTPPPAAPRRAAAQPLTPTRALQEGVLPGEAFTVAVDGGAEVAAEDALPADEEPPPGEDGGAWLSVTCPDGVSAGDALLITTDDGDIEVAVPVRPRPRARPPTHAGPSRGDLTPKRPLPCFKLSGWPVLRAGGRAAGRRLRRADRQLDAAGRRARS